MRWLGNNRHLIASLPSEDAGDRQTGLASTIQYSRGAPKGGKLVKENETFTNKLRLAWSIFFPAKPKNLTPKDEVKKRLRMVLVADRCGMSPSSLADMKKTIIRALEDYVDIDSEDLIEVSISNDPEVGTVYSVNIPVRRVKADVRFADVMQEATSQDGVTLEWHPEEYDSDPSSRFPMGC
eukprot:gene30599-35610_t